MASLQQLSFDSEQVTSPCLANSDLPLERLYACERTRPSALLFTQPLRGMVIEWTWATAMTEVRQMAAWMKAQNWPPGSRVVILSRNCAWWLMADFAIWMAGHVSVPFFPAASSGALTSMFRHCEPVACFLGQFDSPLDFKQETLAHLSCITFPTFSAEMPRNAKPWEEIVQSQKPLMGSPVREATEIATIIYTSGTTGQPKGAMHSFQGLSMMGKSIAPALQESSKGNDRILSYLPLAHIAERAIVETNALFKPLEIFFVDNQETFLEDLKRSRATFFFSVPRLFARFQQKVFESVPETRLNKFLALPLIGWLVRKRLLARLGLAHARMVAGGGAATPVELINWYRKLGLNFIEGYGMTETGITHVPLPGQYRLGFVGHASPYAHTRISVDGEVQIKGPMNMLGYFRSPDLTEQAMTPDGYFRTGDRGEIDGQGRLRLSGRLREEFKTAKGKFVVPARIEMLLSSSPLIESATIFGAGMSLPFALVVLVPEARQACSCQDSRADVEGEVTSLMRRVNGELEQHEQLRFIAVCRDPWTVENGFLTPTLKVRRSALEQVFAGRFKEWESLGQKVIWLEAQ